MFSEYQALVGAAAIASVSVTLSSLESLSLWRQYRDDGLFSWSIHKARSPQLLTSLLIQLYDLAFGYPNVLGLHFCRIGLCAAVLLAHDHRVALALVCAGIGLISILLTIRGPDGKNGADQMAKIIFTSLAVALFSPHLM